MSTIPEPDTSKIPMASNGRPLMSASHKEFLALIRAGKLFTVQALLAEKGYILSANPRKSPLLVAVQSGFHSMVEVMLNSGPTQQEKDAALECAVEKARLDLIELLVERGASPASVSFYDVCRSGHPFIVRFFENRGADMITGDPILGALQFCNEQAFRVCKRHISTSIGIQLQVDAALRYHVAQGNAKWVSLLLWVGANPRISKEGDATALQIAVRRADEAVLKVVRRVIVKEDLNRILASACRGGHVALLREFLEQGADPNGEDTGVSLVWLLLMRIGWLSGKIEIEQALACMGVLLDAGARWNPAEDTSHHIRDARKALYKLDEHNSLDLIQRLHESGALGESFEMFCCTATLRERFQDHLESRLTRHPALSLIYPASAFKRRRKARE